MKSKLVLMSILVIGVKGYSQSYTNLKFSAPLLKNPALAGIRTTEEFNLKFSHFYGNNSYYLDYNRYANKLHGGIGFSTNFGLNEFTKNTFTNYNFSYAFQDKLNDNWNYSLGAGIDFSASYGVTKDTIIRDTYFDYKLGGLLYTKNYFLGFSANNLTKTYRSLNLTTGFEFKPFKDKDLYITPSVQLTYQYNYLTFSSLSLNFKYKNFSFGGGVQYGREFVNLGYDFKKFRVNYSLGNFADGISKYNSHEFSVRFKINNKNLKSKSLRFNPNLF